VHSVVGRFLEHTRVCYFENDGSPQVFCASADWMNRNLFQRVETCFPIIDEALRARAVEEGLRVYLRDNTQSWAMRPDGTYHKIEAGKGEPPLSAQAWLLDHLSAPAVPPTQQLPKRVRRRGKSAKQ
jgi:polyphosphate kinase